jgi:uncharacterized protein Veg
MGLDSYFEAVYNICSCFDNYIELCYTLLKLNTGVIAMIEKGDLQEARKSIESIIGERVQLKANKGRKKSFIKEGVVENSYPSIFIVKFENEYEATRRVSYSYTDLLTNAVELVVL